MNFSIILNVPLEIQASEEEEASYDEDLDDIRSILRDICHELSTKPGVSFQVVTDHSWCVSARIDLCIMMEQLPDTIRDMQHGGVSRLDFYEQGIERCLKFVPEDEAGMVIEIDSLVPSAEAVGTKMSASRDDVVRILCQVGKTFLDAAKRCCPKTANHRWFVEWSCDLEQRIDDIMI